MTIQAIIGGQWGDEGKGKVVDILAAEADAIIRYQGGANAGHTVVVGDDVYKLHLLPSGILHPGKLAIIGNGVVLDPAKLLEEIAGLAARGISCEGRLMVSERAHVVLPWHKTLDGLQEAFRGASKIDTTKRGIGPAYTDKVARQGIRVGELVRPDRLRERLAEVLPIKNATLAAFGGEPVDIEQVLDMCLEHGEKLRPFVVDSAVAVQRLWREGKNLLLEGAQGGLLDLDFGTYPYVTSSCTSAGGIAAGVGLPPRAIDRITGVFKAYTTRVGAGPFPTEDDGPAGATMRSTGQEFGTTTGRPRRCGWFDAVAARWIAALNGIDSIALTKLDVLGELDELRVCTSYELDGERLDHVPAHAFDMLRVKPVYETHPGWKCHFGAENRLEALPREARSYCDRLSELVGAPFEFISTGPSRAATIDLRARLTRGEEAPARTS